MRQVSFVEALHAGGPYAPLAERLSLFGQFVGNWDVMWHGNDTQGEAIVVRGTVHFGWILQGRANQDVWQVPSDPTESAHMRAFHGTTIRFYDASADLWRSIWLDPLNGRVRRFVGRQVEGEIVLEGLDLNPQERWRFSAIRETSFHWTGEESFDGGTTWVVVDQMQAQRQSPDSCPAHGAVTAR